MRYNDYAFISPPRAETKIPPTLLSFYERRGWQAQIKKNGTNSLIFVAPNKELVVKTRHNADHKAWQLTSGSGAIFKRLPGRSWYVINAELLHSKTPHIKDTHYIYDILVDDGVVLLGTTYAQRYARLQKLFLKNPMGSEPSHYILDAHTWLARNMKADFLGVFNSLKHVEDEGLVLRDMTGKLSLNDAANAAWMCKVRRHHKNYTF